MYTLEALSSTFAPVKLWVYLGNLNEEEGPRELCEPKYAVEIKDIFYNDSEDH